MPSTWYWSRFQKHLYHRGIEQEPKSKIKHESYESSPFSLSFPSFLSLFFLMILLYLSFLIFPYFSPDFLFLYESYIDSKEAACWRCTATYIAGALPRSRTPCQRSTGTSHSELHIGRSWVTPKAMGGAFHCTQRPVRNHAQPVAHTTVFQPKMCREVRRGIHLGIHRSDGARRLQRDAQWTPKIYKF